MDTKNKKTHTDENGSIHWLRIFSDDEIMELIRENDSEVEFTSGSDICKVGIAYDGLWLSGLLAIEKPFDSDFSLYRNEETEVIRMGSFSFGIYDMPIREAVASLKNRHNK